MMRQKYCDTRQREARRLSASTAQERTAYYKDTLTFGRAGYA